MSERTQPLLAADGTPLKRSIQRSLRRQKIEAFLLVAPLLAFVLVTFVAPIADMLFRSVENQIVAQTLPETADALKTWDPDADKLPGEAVFAALAVDMKAAVKSKTHTRLGSRLNYEKTGVASLFRKSGRRIKKWDLAEDAPFKEKFLDMDKKWGDPELWQLLKLYSPAYTSGYFLNAVDLRQTPDGIEPRAESEQIYILLFQRTLFMSLAITLMCLLLGYPIAFLLSHLPTRTSNLLMILVLLPFWTSLLVRTSALVLAAFWCSFWRLAITSRRSLSVVRPAPSFPTGLPITFPAR
jgi:putative spermidine/putrescine transport system permease protein